jgi:hypothetical protein
VWENVDKVVAEIHEAKRPGADRVVTDALRAAGFNKIKTSWQPTGERCGILQASREAVGEDLQRFARLNRA